MSLRPFWSYYGGKWRAAPRYPAPVYNMIVEPFAGAAGYSLRYPERQIILVEKYPVIAGIWRYLIAVSSSEVQRLPLVDAVEDLPSWVPQEARDLIGFSLNSACDAPRKQLSAGRKKLRAMGRKYEGWTADRRLRVASQVELIRHWKIIEGDYHQSPILSATYFVDPPYNNKAGSYYVYHSLDYMELARWARALPGQVMVCENEGADWLPFRPFATLKPGVNGHGSKEVLWESFH